MKLHSYSPDPGEFAWALDLDAGLRTQTVRRIEAAMGMLVLGAAGLTGSLVLRALLGWPGWTVVPFALAFLGALLLIVWPVSARCPRCGGAMQAADSNWSSRKLLVCPHCRVKSTSLR